MRHALGVFVKWTDAPATEICIRISYGQMSGFAFLTGFGRYVLHAEFNIMDGVQALFFCLK